MTEDFEKVENQLKEYMDRVKEIQLPATNNNEDLLSGIRRVKQHRRRIQGLKMGGLTAAAILIGFILLANLSTSFVNVTANTPLLSDFAKLVQLNKDDSELQQAVQQGYVQAVHVKDTKDDITFEVSNIVIDNSRLILFYNVSTNGKSIPTNYLDNFQLLNANKDSLERLVQFDFDNLNDEPYGTGKIDFTLNQNVPMTDTILFSATVRDGDQNHSNQVTFDLKIPINKSMIGAKRTYSIDKWFTIDGQRLYFRDAVMYPTQTMVHIRFDENNTKKFLQLSDLHLEDKNGETLAQKSMVSHGDKEWTAYLNNTHYGKVVNPTLVLTKIMALDKDKAYVELNLHTKKLIKAPKGLLLKGFSEKGDSYELQFSTKSEEGNISELLSNQFQDNTGRTFDAIGNEISIEGKSEIVTFDIQKENYQEPLKFDLTGYPSYIFGNIQIPLNK